MIFLVILFLKFFKIFKVINIFVINLNFILNNKLFFNKF